MSKEESAKQAFAEFDNQDPTSDKSIAEILEANGWHHVEDIWCCATCEHDCPGEGGCNIGFGCRDD